MLGSQDALRPKKLLITGASGFLGWHLCSEAQSDWQVFGVTYTHDIKVSGCSMVSVDLRDFASLKQLMQAIQPDAVIHAAAQARPHVCQAQPQATFSINVEASWLLAALCADQNIPLLLISTDLVFDGQHPPYSETDAVSPINRYGEQKVMAEQGMVERYPQTLICRMPLMFGVVPHAPSFMQSLIQKLQAGQPLPLFEDEFRTPVSGFDAARGVLMALGKGKGYIHLGGPDRMSRYEFGQHLVNTLGFPISRLQGCLQADVDCSAPRPADVSLDSSLAFSLGYAPQSVAQALSCLLAVT